MSLGTSFSQSFHQAEELRDERGQNKKLVFCITPLSRTIRDFSGTRASPSAGAACERSVGVPWEHDFEQKAIKICPLLEPLQMLLRAALMDPLGPPTTSMEPNHSANALHDAPLTLSRSPPHCLVHGKCQNMLSAPRGTREHPAALPAPASGLVWTGAA